MMFGMMCSMVIKMVRVTAPAVKREVLCHDLAAAMTDREVDVIMELLMKELQVGGVVPVEELQMAVERRILMELGV